MSVAQLEMATVPKPPLRRCWLVRLAAATAVFVALAGVQLAYADRIVLFWQSVGQRWCVPGAQTFVVGEKTLRTMPMVLNVLFTLAGLAHLALVPLLLSLYTYHRLTPHVPRLDGNTYCGHCGYILKGLTEPRCPECGQVI